MALRDDVSVIIQSMEDAAKKAGRVPTDGAYVAVTVDVVAGKALVTATGTEDGSRDLREVKKRTRAMGYTVEDYGRGAVRVTGTRRQTAP